MENLMKSAEMGSPAPKIRPLLPEGYLGTIADETGCTSYSYISQVVKTQNVRAGIWPAVVTLAEKTNPAGFAAWAAAHPDKLPAKAAA